LARSLQLLSFMRTSMTLPHPLLVPDPSFFGRGQKESQLKRYAAFYAKNRRLRRLLRFDVRYRCRRLRELMNEHGIVLDGLSVCDYGFGSGDLLASLPTSCELRGLELSPSAVQAAQRDPRFSAYAKASFEVVPEHECPDLGTECHHLVLCSHVLEHAPDDFALLRSFRRMLVKNGLLIVFVPIEEPDYIPFHVRNYSLQSIATTVAQAGFDVLLVEGSMHINGHLWKLITIPSRRGWPLLGPVVDTLRQATLSTLPYPLVRGCDRVLHALDFSPRQALVLARRRG